MNLAIYRDLGRRVLYVRPDYRLFRRAVMDLWRDDDPKKRWAKMQYFIRKMKFEIAFIYPDELDPAETEADRRTRVLQQYYGKKPIIYPSA